MTFLSTDTLRAWSCFLLVLALVALAPGGGRSPASAADLVGDANCDGKVSSIDSLIILQSVAGLTSLPCAEKADANVDGRVGTLDAAVILQFVAGFFNQLPPPTVRITSPPDGAMVALEIDVEFEASEFAHVLVRPDPDDPDQNYWVQNLATPTGDATWVSSGVFIGQESDPRGFPFRICAVISQRDLTPGDNLSRLPAGVSHCVDVTRA